MRAFSITQARDTAKDSAVADMMWLGFFFLGHPSEYTEKSEDSSPFRACDATLFMGELPLPYVSASSIPVFLLTYERRTKPVISPNHKGMPAAGTTPMHPVPDFKWWCTSQVITKIKEITRGVSFRGFVFGEGSRVVMPQQNKHHNEGNNEQQQQQQRKDQNFEEMSSPNRKKKNSIACRQCGGPHITICCPLRTPEETPRSWKQMQEDYVQREETKPFKCLVPVHPGKDHTVYADSAEQFWEEIKTSHDHSLFRDFVGVLKLDGDGGTGNMLFPPGYACLDPGTYKLYSRTHGLSLSQLFSAITDGVSALKANRPLSEETVKAVQSKMLLLFNHFSLSHEGNALNFEETEMLTELLLEKDWKRVVEEEQKLDKDLRKVPGSEHDIREATNHILVSQQLGEMAKTRTAVDETFVLQLHSWIMHGLIEDHTFGGPGEYRKTKIGVTGSTKGRPPFADVPPLMKRFFEIHMERKTGEDLLEYLARAHSEFQYIHPFVDGNGRIGRLIMNTVLIQHGYPVLVLPTALSIMFNHAVEMGHRGDLTLFTRLLAESIFKSLDMYEEALEVKLLPSAEELDPELSMAEGPRTVSP